MFGDQLTYMAKPIYEGHDTSQMYNAVKTGISTGTNEEEVYYYLMPSIHRSHTFKAINLSYGIFGYGGYYNLQQIQKERGLKGFLGLGARGSFNLNIVGESSEWRILGVEAALSQEYGTFKQFRAVYDNIDQYELYNGQGELLDIALTTEVLSKNSKNGNYSSIKLALGGGKGAGIRTDYYAQATGTLKREKFIFHISSVITVEGASSTLGIMAGIQLPLKHSPFDR